MHKYISCRLTFPLFSKAYYQQLLFERLKYDIRFDKKKIKKERRREKKKKSSTFFCHFTLGRYSQITSDWPVHAAIKNHCHLWNRETPQLRVFIMIRPQLWVLTVEAVSTAFNSATSPATSKIFAISQLFSGVLCHKHPSAFYLHQRKSLLTGQLECFGRMEKSLSLDTYKVLPKKTLFQSHSFLYSHFSLNKNANMHLLLL